MDNQLLFMLSLFSAVALGVYFAARLFTGKDEDADKLRERLTDGSETTSSAPNGESSVSMWQRVGQAAAKPFMPKTREKQSDLRKMLGYAGIYSPSAFRLMTGCKVILLGVGLLSGYLIGMATGSLFLSVSMGGLLGYMLPTMWLRLQIRQHQKLLDHGLADALDLMVVCVEAGLTIDSAIERVGREMTLAHPGISREFGITHMETRVGLSRAEALRNLGQRTGSSSLQSLAAMLIQADRFGTSIASALRIHAEGLRANRQHAAEEMAAKASVKMSFPLILFILPAALIVLVGPLVLNFIKSGFLND